MFIKDGKPFMPINGMEIDGVQIVLPLNADRMAELGITEVPDPVRPDDRFYWVTQNEDGTYSATPKDRAITDGIVWERIKAERDRRQVGGVKVGDKWFHSDMSSRIQQMGLVFMGANIPQGLQWKTMDGSFIVMTQALAQQVFNAQAASDQTIFGIAEAHRVALAAAPDPAAYDYLTGWPKIYGEE